MKLSQFIIVVNNITSFLENYVMTKYKPLRYPKTNDLAFASIVKVIGDWAEIILSTFIKI